MAYKKQSSSFGFTIVELLVVIVVIGILAAITIVSYTGIQQKAVVASLTSDLANASRQLKMFQVDNSTYPTTINCAIPDSTTNKCIKSAAGTTYTYKTSPTNISIFCLEATKSSGTYNITQEGQLLAGPCPVLNLDAGNTLSYSGTGTTWKDLSGNDNNGTLVNGVAYNTANGGVMSFDGVDDTGVINNNSSLNPVSAITLSVWINSNNLTGEHFFIEKSYGEQWELGTSGNQIKMDGKFNGVYYSGYIITTTANLVLSTWYNIAFTFDGVTGKVYINGVKNTERSNVSGSVGATTGNLYIGSRGNSYAFFNGKIGNIGIYNSALSASEILQNFNTTKARYGL